MLRKLHFFYDYLNHENLFPVLNIRNFILSIDNYLTNFAITMDLVLTLKSIFLLTEYILEILSAICQYYSKTTTEKRWNSLQSETIRISQLKLVVFQQYEVLSCTYDFILAYIFDSLISLCISISIYFRGYCCSLFCIIIIDNLLLLSNRL